MITDPHKWNIAAARIQGFIAGMPHNAHEKHVEEYHSILHDYELACDQDFSAFKIPDSALSATDYRPVENMFLPSVPNYRFCDPVIFRAKVFGLVQFVLGIRRETVGHDPPSKKTSDLKEMASNIYIGEMHGSQFVQNSPNTSIKNAFNPKSQEFSDLVKDIKAAIPKLGLDKEKTNQLFVDIGTVEVQISGSAPKTSIIAESMHSIRNIFEGLVGSAIASGLLPAISQYFPK